MSAFDNIYVIVGLRSNETAGKYPRPTVTLTEALKRVYDDERLMLQYHMTLNGKRLSKGFRVKKDDVFKSGVNFVFQVQMADLDKSLPGPDGKPVKTPLTLEENLQVARCAKQCGYAFYPTKNGFRLLRPLSRGLNQHEFEVCQKRWFDELVLIINNLRIPGLRVDTGVKEWNRLFKLPRIVREDGFDLRKVETLNLDCPVYDPGDCSPEPKPDYTRGIRQEYSGTTEYAQSALDRECASVASAESGEGTEKLKLAAFNIGTLVGAGALSHNEAIQGLEAALSQGGRDPENYQHTLNNCLKNGMLKPRDLSKINSYQPETKTFEEWRDGFKDADDLGDVAFEAPELTAGQKLIEAYKNGAAVSWRNCRCEVFEEDGTRWVVAYRGEWEAYKLAEPLTQLGEYVRDVNVQNGKIIDMFTSEEANV